MPAVRPAWSTLWLSMTALGRAASAAIPARWQARRQWSSLCGCLFRFSSLDLAWTATDATTNNVLVIVGLDVSAQSPTQRVAEIARVQKRIPSNARFEGGSNVSIRRVAVPSHAQRSSGGRPHRRYGRMVADRPGRVGRSICRVFRQLARGWPRRRCRRPSRAEFAAAAATRLQSTARLSAKRLSAPVTAIGSTSTAMLSLMAAMSGAIGKRQRTKWKAS